MSEYLRDYRAKRDFDATPEPSGADGDAGDGAGRFVIHHHLASSEHYDLRLESDGVLKSWAVPKGPSTNPDERRLAVPTEDHPLDYIDFEGVIPADEYGGGSVVVWDRGTYRVESRDDGERRSLADGLEDGHVSVWLEGEKIRGGYALVKTGDERWLFTKADDEGADARRNPTSTQPESVESGTTAAELLDDAERS